jgi:energy-coupling factor transport system substrate-specific component
MENKKYYWQTRELVVIGTFTAMIRIVSFLISITGGGMNPLSMIAKNVVQTALLIILIFSVRKFGTFTLYVLISSAISMITMGSGLMTMPGMLLGGFLCDLIIKFAGGFKSNFAVLAGVAFFDFFNRAISLSIGYLMVRENKTMLIFATVAVVLGYLGCLIGLFVGKSLSKELRHAGLIRK